MTENEHLENNAAQSDSDEEPQLSADVLQMINEIRSVAAAEERTNVNTVPEDWSLSQFWYSNESSNTLANEVIRLAKTLPTERRRICFLSCPSIYLALLKHEELTQENIQPYLYEFDPRFRSGHEENFVLYDYNAPLSVPTEHQRSFDLIIADPPHLSEGCFVNYGMTIATLRREKDSPIMFCTGLQMSDLIHRLFGCRETTFQPVHERKLGNEFRCFTTYKPLTFEWSGDAEKEAAAVE